jgi:hypothetical protein
VIEAYARSDCEAASGEPAHPFEEWRRVSSRVNRPSPAAVPASTAAVAGLEAWLWNRDALGSGRILRLALGARFAVFQRWDRRFDLTLLLLRSTQVPEAVKRWIVVGVFRHCQAGGAPTFVESLTAALI